jgi:hypothetical protein
MVTATLAQPALILSLAHFSLGTLALHDAGVDPTPGAVQTQLQAGLLDQLRLRGQTARTHGNLGMIQEVLPHLDAWISQGGNPATFDALVLTLCAQVREQMVATVTQTLTQLEVQHAIPQGGLQVYLPLLSAPLPGEEDDFQQALGIVVAPVGA